MGLGPPAPRWLAPSGQRSERGEGQSGFSLRLLSLPAAQGVLACWGFTNHGPRRLPSGKLTDTTRRERLPPQGLLTHLDAQAPSVCWAPCFVSM